jgi:hypothetical protein
MLFLTGTRDALCRLDLLRDVTAPLPNATVHVVDDGDHSFAVRKSSGRDAAAVLDELVQASVEWLRAPVTESVEGAGFVKKSHLVHVRQEGPRFPRAAAPQSGAGAALVEQAMVYAWSALEHCSAALRPRRSAALLGARRPVTPGFNSSTGGEFLHKPGAPSASCSPHPRRRRRGALQCGAGLVASLVFSPPLMPPASATATAMPRSSSPSW